MELDGAAYYLNEQKKVTYFENCLKDHTEIIGILLPNKNETTYSLISRPLIIFTMIFRILLTRSICFTPVALETLG